MTGFTESKSVFYTPKFITTLEVEATSYCNSFCGACHRNIEGGPLAKHMTLTHMSKNIWRKIISSETLEHIEIINFDGNIGDASMHPRLIEMLEQLAGIKPTIEVRISTNGGARTTEFWGLLAKTLLKFKSHCLTFSVDGLEDTNELYRRGVKWNRLIANIKSFNSNGGTSRWRCIVFDHNICQIDEIQNTAKRMGCTYFVTFRNRKSSIYQQAYKSLPETTLKSPSLETFNARYKKSVFLKKPKFKKKESSFFRDKNFNCPFAEEGKVSIDQYGVVWPCCFTSISSKDQMPVKLYKDNCNIQQHSLREILSFFQKNLYNAWKLDPYPVCVKCLHKTNPPTFSIRPST